ncbi:MAG: type II toxin-antitoxin system VapC family toxin [Thiocapsa sp.]|uniref:type II toxin-antitoxin system VapC family toxin n=1 Tax=Thiocapsa sp. TaxID=2024551 RepID=UPI001BCE6187|nr:type II toxin-antitoxin system VapC family toxin [Thiocapsa sp.]QVL48733.1 MAG: type II toxin-antitoxin system VapC family toxin [Thiocapsa sp.]
MVVDTSSLVCILLDEPEAEHHARCLVETDSAPVMSAPTRLETMLVMTARRGEAGRSGLEELLALAAIDILPVDAELARTAYQSWLRYGKGRHPAGLNFGDCFSHALAKHRQEALLFKGEDFSKTDVASAL